MGTIADKLLYLATTKENIRQSIIRKGVDVSETLRFRDYPEKILEIETGSGEAKWEDMAASFIDFDASDDSYYGIVNKFTEILVIEEVPNVPAS